MEENIADTLLATSDVLHWLGKYREANTLIILSRLLRAKELDTFEQLEKFVLAVESAYDEEPPGAWEARDVSSI